MVKSPKSGRELDGQRIYKGPPWVARLVRKYLGPDDSEAANEEG